jgi:hypothetical protein
VAQTLGRELRAIALKPDSGAAVALSQLLLRDLQEWRVPLPFSHAFAPSGYERFLRAEWLRELGQDDEASGWYAGLGEEDLQGLIYVAPSHARLAELYHRKGDWDRARTHYQRFIHWWREADPELQPLVDSARARLATFPRGYSAASTGDSVRSNAVARRRWKVPHSPQSSSGPDRIGHSISSLCCPRIR